ncbi:hypothetical protein [Achromobacter animicus]|uniref:hypothetical protein n=1 Tax=Achromobacter animicus TaxID=1389935 RepID=UPI0028A6BA3C|nr:hypothetical protein [Achromobacter animicus]
MLEVFLEQLADLMSRGWVSILIGGLIAWVAYLKTRNRKQLSWGFGCDELLGLDKAAIPSGLEVRFDDTPIPRLSRTVIFIWNSAEQTIRGDDVVEPIRVSVCQGKDRVLRASALRVSRDVCNVSAEVSAPDRNEVLVKFSYLDRRDGAVIEILHTGEAHAPTILGTIIGIPGGLSRVGSISATPPANEGIFERVTRLRLPYYLTMLAGLAFIAVELYLSWQWRQSGLDVPRKIAGNGTMIIGIVYLVIGALGLFFKRRRQPKSLLIR